MEWRRLGQEEVGGLGKVGNIWCSYKKLVYLFGKPDRGDGALIGPRWTVMFWDKNDPTVTVEAEIYCYRKQDRYKTRKWGVIAWHTSTMATIEKAINCKTETLPYHTH